MDRYTWSRFSSSPYLSLDIPHSPIHLGLSLMGVAQCILVSSVSVNEGQVGSSSVLTACHQLSEEHCPTRQLVGEKESQRPKQFQFQFQFSPIRHKNSIIGNSRVPQFRILSHKSCN
ncbi:hypothetical protein M431DRAFT_296229 [Trichoderma harzianum CBS 226.95]|uniref:Uncharacterized protein n=1 Tax=Trichoderma harzianum CBS 226.95 TaxID=983964 RepID=A0A2T4AQ47_TRIHA|nr:hypothetical protein M431DRAFT_296229 [Trichoderma harzianum CBS 226.95]PTB59187.1 hypothetical protein M431DRAFT_296229 [Trichoderma harzianum CBS 226.95]